MHPAAKAIENAISLEAKKDGLRQKQSGKWVLTLMIDAADMDQRLALAAMGTRYQCTLTEVDDDEVNHDLAVEFREKWRSLGPARQAGVRCKDPVFWAFLREEKKIADVNDDERAAQSVRSHCCVLSRSDLNKPGHQKQRILWYGLDTQFQAWRARERHG